MNNLKKTALKIIKRVEGDCKSDICIDFLNALKGQEFYFEDDDLLSTEIVKENYLDKYNIQEHVLKDKSVQGYIDFNKKISEFTESEIHVFTFCVTDSAFILFFDKKLSTLIGILRSFAQNKHSIEELNRKYVTMGLETRGISISL